LVKKFDFDSHPEMDPDPKKKNSGSHKLQNLVRKSDSLLIIWS